MEPSCRRIMSRSKRLPQWIGAILVLLLCWLWAPREARAQSVPPEAFSALRWRLVGPFRGGRSLAVAGIPGNATTFYFGVVDGGVWRTTNAGLTWEPLFDDQPISSVGALAVAPSDPRVIWVGTGEADMRSDMTHGAGVYRTTDGGEHWEHLGLDDTRHIGKILVDPRNADVAWVAALGHGYGPNPERGVFRTTDGGRTWSKVLYHGPDVGAADLAMDPSNPDVVWATLWNARRPAWSQYPPLQGPGSGIFRTSDGGATWTEVAGHGLPTGQLGRIGLALARTPTGLRVYALVDAPEDNGLYRSDDGGGSWELVSTNQYVRTRGWYFGRVFVDPHDPDVVYVPNQSILRSTDGGHTFSALKGSPGGDDYHYLWIDPTEGSRMIIGADQGVGVSLDGGRTWSPWYNQPTAQFYHVVTDDHFPYRIYGAQQDAGTVGISSRSDYGLLTFRDWQSVGAGESGYIAPDPLDPDVIYGGSTYGGVYRWNRRTGQVQDISPWPLSSFGDPMPARKYRFTWTSPIVFDPLDPRTLYLGSHKLLRTRDGGLHWTEASPDLTGAQPGAEAHGALSVENASERGWGVVYSVAPSPVREGVIWAGTDDGRVQVTRDGGGSWSDVTPEAMSAWSKVSLIEASPFDAGSAYMAVDRHRLDDVAPYIYRTDDFGAHWTRIDEGIPDGAFLRAVRADPAQEGLLYAGTELGPYVSFDDGAHWQSLALNLPTASVRDLAVKDNDLVAATHGRAFWVLDDVTVLQQLAAGGGPADAPHLYRPERAFRLKRSWNTDTPLPPEIPHGENPPAGAVLDYWLPTAPSGPLTIEILDASGNVVRSFSSDERPDTAPMPYFSRWWLPRPAIPGARSGHSRFVWDLRYPPPPVDEPDYSIAAIADQGTVAVPQGPLVLPGSYQVRLSVDGTVETQPLEVRMDPRVEADRSMLASQLELAIEVWNGAAEAHALEGAISDLQRQAESRAKEDLDATSRAALTVLRRRLDSLADSVSASSFGGLISVVQEPEREATAQSREAYRVLRSRLDRARAGWDSLLQGPLTRANEELRHEGAAPLSAELPEVPRLRAPGDGG